MDFASPAPNDLPSPSSHPTRISGHMRPSLNLILSEIKRFRQMNKRSQDERSPNTAGSSTNTAGSGTGPAPKSAFARLYVFVCLLLAQLLRTHPRRIPQSWERGCTWYQQPDARYQVLAIRRYWEPIVGKITPYEWLRKVAILGMVASLVCFVALESKAPLKIQNGKI